MPPLPQFDENAQVMVAPAIATAVAQKLNYALQRQQICPEQFPLSTKIAEVQIIKLEDTKDIRPVDIATFKLLEDPKNSVLQ